MKRKHVWRKLLVALVFAFVLLNAVAALHAWRFTHFTPGAVKMHPEDMSVTEKLIAIFTGVENPRPVDARFPVISYETVVLKHSENISCWKIKTTQESKGIVCLFHGYGGAKSDMLDKAYTLLDAGYDVLLADFRGAGGSGGNNTTIGYKEADDVKLCYDYMRNNQPGKVFLLGTSMGAVAIMRCIAVHNIRPDAIILECPFGKLYTTVCARFAMMKIPAFPMAALLTFWGGVENGFNGFTHNPVEYAKAITCPTLLLFGERDDRVSRQEIDNVFQNLAGPKELHTYKEAGHVNYLAGYKDAWTLDVISFMSAHN